VEEQSVVGATELEPGQLLGDYEVLSVAGIGGMGLVYRARQRFLERLVALKVIRSDVGRLPEYRDRFLREARLAASVNHPHVVSVYDVGDDADCLFLAMQWIEGEDLQRVLELSGRLAPERAVLIASQLAGALDSVHGVGLIHRDVKPGNVLIRQVGGGDHAYLTDFGVAKPSDANDQLTKTGWVVGTAGYLSPEQIRGREPGPGSDLYGLGCVFFEALTGRPPFSAENEMALRWAHANDPRPTASSAIPELGDRYDSFLVTALAVDPDQRFGSGRQFIDALTRAYGGQDRTASTAPLTPTHAPTAVGPPTPVPPPPQTPLPAAYPAYGYATPPPAYPAQSRSGSPLALILLAIVALAGIAAGVLAASGVFSHKSSAGTATNGAVTHAASRSLKKPAPTPPAGRKTGSASAATAGTTSCGGGLSVGPNTSCGFAQNVEQTYDQTTGGAQTVSAYSPATGIIYTINCSGAEPHICTGGTTHDASVYFTSSPSSSAPASATPPASTAGLHACDQNIYANASTSCKFAENVFYEYTQSAQNPSGQVMTIYSPVTQQDYPVTCTPDAEGDIECSSNTDSYATFSQASVDAYTPAVAAAYASSADLGDSNPNG
jgi:serine/threonine protein kinase